MFSSGHNSTSYISLFTLCFTHEVPLILIIDRDQVWVPGEWNTQYVLF